jgi:hypothetical protein
LFAEAVRHQRDNKLNDAARARNLSSLCYAKRTPPPALADHFRAMFADAGWSMSDLGKCDAVEAKYPNIFDNMYQFWVQKS